MAFNKTLLSALSIALGVTFPLGLADHQVLANAEPTVLAQRPADLESCQYLREVTTGETSIRKQIQVRLLTGNNWNTDFVVPSTERFQYYVALMTPENDATYDVTINLRYPNNSTSTALNRNMPMIRDTTYTMLFQSPTNDQPFQINFRIGGPNNNAYVISALACR